MLSSCAHGVCLRTVSDEQEREKVLGLLDEAEKGGAGLQEQAQQIAEKAQSVRDDALITRRIVASGMQLSPAKLKQLETTWRQQNDANRSWAHELRETIVIYGATATGTNVVSTSTVTEMNAAIVVSPSNAALSYAVKHYAALAERGNAADQVRAALTRCALDRRQGDLRSALDLLDDADRAVRQPSGTATSPTAVLIPLREAIGAAVQELLKRRPKQEPASTWVEKVLSIGTGCGRADLPEGYFQRLADLTSEKMNRLSGAKERAMTREAVLVEYYDGLKHLSALLDGVDEKKFRP